MILWFSIHSALWQGFPTKLHIREEPPSLGSVDLSTSICSSQEGCCAAISWCTALISFLQGGHLMLDFSHGNCFCWLITLMKHPGTSPSQCLPLAFPLSQDLESHFSVLQRREHQTCFFSWGRPGVREVQRCYSVPWGWNHSITVMLQVSIDEMALWSHGHLKAA